METLKKNILDIIITEVNSINEKVKGLNFLEILKINLIAKILPIVNNLKFPLDQFDNLEKQINEENRSIKISIQYFTNSFIIRKKIIDQDTLFLFFNEASSFDIYKDDKNFVNLLLYKNTGISLSNSTAINSKFNKNLLSIWKWAGIFPQRHKRISSRIRSYSSGLRPWAAISSSVMAMVFGMDMGNCLSETLGYQGRCLAFV